VRKSHIVKTRKKLSFIRFLHAPMCTVVPTILLFSAGCLCFVFQRQLQRSSNDLPHDSGGALDAIAGQRAFRRGFAANERRVRVHGKSHHHQNNPAVDVHKVCNTVLYMLALSHAVTALPGIRSFSVSIADIIIML